MRKRLIHRVLFAVSIFYSQATLAVSADYQVGVGFMNFDYAEYDDNNVFLDGDSGFIPGVLFSIKLNNQRTYTEFVGQIYANTIEYDGQTQGGTPLKTDSDAVIIDTHAKFGIAFSPARNHGPYTGLGFRYWFRNIRSGKDINGNSVAGLLEQYYWNYGLLGYMGKFQTSENIALGFDVRATHMLNGKMHVNFLGYKNYDNAQVNLGNRAGLRLAWSIQKKLRNNELIVSPYYEILDIGKSNTVRVSSDGVPTNTYIHEPRSETRNMGIEITWYW